MTRRDWLARLRRLGIRFALDALGRLRVSGRLAIRDRLRLRVERPAIVEALERRRARQASTTDAVASAFRHQWHEVRPPKDRPFRLGDGRLVETVVVCRLCGVPRDGAMPWCAVPAREVGVIAVREFGGDRLIATHPLGDEHAMHILRGEISIDAARAARQKTAANVAALRASRRRH